MKLFIPALFLLQLLGCQKATDAEIDIFFERLAVLVTKLDIINKNIANANVTRTAEGGPFVPKEAVECRNGACKIQPLRCSGIGCPPHDQAIISAILKYEPKHPDANANGYVAYPNLNVAEEITKLIRVQRAIEYLMDGMPVTKSYFYSDDIQKYFSKYPALNHDYNFEKLLRE